MLNSLTFRPLKLRQTHCLSHPVKQATSHNSDDVAIYHIASVYNNGQQNALYKRLKYTSLIIIYKQSFVLKEYMKLEYKFV